MLHSETNPFVEVRTDMQQNTVTQHRRVSSMDGAP
jgi:hypothetical protein